MEKTGPTSPDPQHLEPGRGRAAEYVRMSTEHQQYSTENQRDVIRQWAEKRGVTIARTYEDAGKSGLRIAGRDALQRLIEDVQAGRADFDVILVYDVSRWGRFQDADESAYYEYICRRANVGVQYCAEQFENDGSAISTMLKGFKRFSAGEYSRELSVKVFHGQCRLVELGFHQGGAPGFGLRRMLRDQSGNPKGVLARGEHKSIQTDRVVLVPGPPQEIEIVRWMYLAFVEEGKIESEIAKTLNERGVQTDLGRPWTRGTVHQVLTNEKYVGNNVYNRISFKLKKKRVLNPADMWIRANGAFEPIISTELFEGAQKIVLERSKKLADEELLERLRALLTEKGNLSGLLIDETEDMPSSSVYKSRFSSLVRAYRLIGYTPDRDYAFIEVNRQLRQLHPKVITEMVERIRHLGGVVVQDPKTDLLTVNGEFTVSLVVARCRRTESGSLRWSIRLDTGLAPDITVAARMDEENKVPLDYYLLPAIDITPGKLLLARDNGVQGSEEDPAGNRLGPTHRLAQAVQGKEVGQKIQFLADTPAESEYEIVQIQSKYVSAFQDSLARFNERFPTHQGLMRVDVDLQDPTKIVQMLEAQRARSERALSMYQAGSLPACTLARLLGRSDVELFAGLLADPSTKVRSSLGIGAQIQEELALLQTTPAILVESSALVTLEYLGLLAKLAGAFQRVCVTQQTLDAIAETALNLDPGKRAGQMYSDAPGHICMVEQSSEQVEAQKQFFQRIVEFLRSSAEIISPTTTEALGEFEKDSLQKMLGPAACSAVAAGIASGIPMYSDDLALRLVARNSHGIRSVWAQTLLQHLRTKDIISAEEYHRAVARLIDFGLQFVSIDSNDLLWVLRSNAWSPTADVARFARVLSGPECNEGEAVRLVVDVLHELWSQPVHPQSRQLLLDVFIQVLLVGRNPLGVFRALLGQNASRSLLWTQATGEIQKAIQLWFSAKRRGL